MFDGTGRISLRWFHVYTADAVSYLGYAVTYLLPPRPCWPCSHSRRVVFLHVALCAVSTIFSSLQRKTKLGYWDTESGEF